MYCISEFRFGSFRVSFEKYGLYLIYYVAETQEKTILVDETFDSEVQALFTTTKTVYQDAPPLLQDFTPLSNKKTKLASK